MSHLHRREVSAKSIGGEVTQEFFKFPSTPHLAVLTKDGVRDDKVFSDAERSDFLKNELVVEEKIDGANLGISFNSEGQLIFQNRGSLINPPYAGQWKKLSEWVAPREEALFEHLGEQYILFGEWCYAQHSISYDRLPDWFLGFDVFDKYLHRFLSTPKRNALFAATSIAAVPMVTKGCFGLGDLKDLFTHSRFADHYLEGVYLRWEDADWLIERAKLVRGSFTQQIEEHWSRKTIIPNKLAK